MNTNKSKIIGIATALLTATASVAVAGDKEKSNTSHDGMKSDGHHALMRVSEDRIDSLTTAKDLIGASVYDSNGDKIGDIADISFSRDLTASIAHNKSNWGDSKKKMDSSKSDEMKNKSDWSDKKSDMHAKSMAPKESIVFISVGGLFGIGDDLVQIPASQLSYDSENERYLLNNYSKEQVANVAQIDDQDFNELDYYSTPPNLYSTYPPVERGWDDATDRAKRSYDSTDADMIRDAFDNDETIGLYASLIDIEVKENEVVLSGTVSDNKTKKQAEKLAKKATDKSVKNDIQVSDY